MKIKINTSKMKPKTSIFIPIKNAGKDFYFTLKKIYEQKEKNFEVILVDSGSTDRTLEIAKKFPVKIFKIKSSDFGHGKTRNLAIKFCKGEYIVFLTQDAIPFNEFWLSKLIKNFNDKKIAGVYSRQIPKKNANEMITFSYNYYFPKTIVKNKDSLLIEKIFFSNVSSCIRRSILKKYSFNENVLLAEDQEWAKKVIENGYKTLYEPESIVIHSHNYNLKKTFQIYFDATVSLNKIIGNMTGKKNLKLRINFMKHEFKHMLSKNPFLIFPLILVNLSKISGITLGLIENRLPLSLKKRLSIHKYYWDNLSKKLG